MGMLEGILGVIMSYPFYGCMGYTMDINVDFMGQMIINLICGSVSKWGIPLLWLFFVGENDNEPMDGIGFSSLGQGRI